MLLKNAFAKRVPRTFSFHPYYYKKAEETDEAAPRIRFRRLRKGVEVKKKSIRGLIYLVILVMACLYYLFDQVKKEAQTFEMNDIRIEQSPSGF